jgi:hypothetical protein
MGAPGLQALRPIAKARDMYLPERRLFKNEAV